MIVGSIVGHGNAIVKPLLYGVQLFRLLNHTGSTDTSESKELLDAADPEIVLSVTNGNQQVVR